MKNIKKLLIKLNEHKKTDVEIKELLSKQDVNDKNVLLFNLVFSCVILIGYLAEYFKGAKTIGYITVFACIMCIPLIIASVMYVKNILPRLIRLVTILGFLLIYSFVIMTSEIGLTFVYMFPMTVIYMLYFDFKIMFGANLIMLVINCMDVYYNIFTLKNTSATDIIWYEIQLLSVLMFAFSILLTTGLSNKYNRLKLENVKNEQEKQKHILDDVMNIATILSQNAQGVYDIVDNISSITSDITVVMRKISEESDVIKENTDTQVTRTTDIQNIISVTTNLSNEVDTLSKNTMDSVSDGMKKMDMLKTKSEITSNNSQSLSKVVTKLNQSIIEIGNITDVISLMADETMLLSVNAFIESRRAGEAGKTFGVVAEEIRNLAEVSKEKAKNIEDITINLIRESDESLKAVQVLNKTGLEQLELMNETKHIFDEIASKMDQVDRSIGIITGSMEDILNSNELIVSNIKEISSFATKTSVETTSASDLIESGIVEMIKSKQLAEELVDASKLMEKYK